MFVLCPQTLRCSLSVVPSYVSTTSKKGQSVRPQLAIAPASPQFDPVLSQPLISQGTFYVHLKRSYARMHECSSCALPSLFPSLAPSPLAPSSPPRNPRESEREREREREKARRIESSEEWEFDCRTNQRQRGFTDGWAD